jgi:hypothetical protein
MKRLAAALTLLAGASAGCASSRYQPRVPNRVAQIMANGELAYARDGRVYKRGVFGGGLITAVAGDPQAEYLARRSRDSLRDGFWMGVLGMVCAEVGLVWWLIEEDQVASGAKDSRRDANVALVVGGACALVSGWGFSKMYDGQIDALDAVNVFNDNAALRERSGGGAAGAPAPTGYVPPWPPPPRRP